MTGSRDRFMDILQSWGVQISDAAVDLLQKMLVLNPRDRLTLDEVLEHSWMEGTEVSPYG
jgi:serine/threonine protein kinase